jgi:hypothetical protein
MMQRPNTDTKNDYGLVYFRQTGTPLLYEFWLSVWEDAGDSDLQQNSGECDVDPIRFEGCCDCGSITSRHMYSAVKFFFKKTGV